MKSRLSLILGSLFLLGQVGTVWAATAFTVSATVPTANSISILVDQVNATGTPVFTPVSGTALSFDAGGGMTFNATNNIYLPSVYYALNIATAGGGGLPDTTLTYTEGVNPNGATNGLGYKATVTFAQELGSVETITALGKKRLIDLTGTVGHEPYTALASGSYLRVYLGVWTGSTTAPADPSNGQPFSNADAPGLYSGSLLVTAVVN